MLAKQRMLTLFPLSFGVTCKLTQAPLVKGFEKLLANQPPSQSASLETRD
jgi:hypothetical protein